MLFVKSYYFFSYFCTFSFLFAAWSAKITMEEEDKTSTTTEKPIIKFSPSIWDDEVGSEKEDDAVLST